MEDFVQPERIARLEEQGKNQSEIIKSILKKLDNLPDKIGDKMDLRLREMRNILTRREDYCRSQNARMTLLEQFRVKVETSWKWIMGLSTILAGLIAWSLEIVINSLV